MRFPILTAALSVSELRLEVRYTLAVMRHRPWASVHVPTFETLLKDVGQLAVVESSLTDKVADAAAGIDEVDLHLDVFVEATTIDARVAVDKDTSAPLWRSLFGTYRPSELQRPKLGAELEQVRAWPDLLRAAPTPALRDRAAECAQLIKAADLAVKAQGDARSAVQIFKSNQLVPFVARLNAERSGLAGAAAKQAFDGAIRLEAAQGLFHRAARRPARPDTLASVQASIAASEAELTRLRAVLTTLQEEQTASEQAAARRKADEEALRTLLAHQAAATQQIAELERRLGS